MKKILVTGSNGLLGQKIIYRLVDLRKKGNLDWEIIASSRGSNRLIVQDGYSYFSLDISDKSETQKLIIELKPDCVINTAATTNVDGCETKREECWNTNVNGVKNLVSALESMAPYFTAGNRGMPHLVHISTDFIFDGNNGPYKEDDAPNPLSYYALSKLESEKVVTTSNIEWAVLRTIIIYGVADNMSRSNIVLWAKESLEKKQSIRVVTDQFRAPTLAEDLAQACISAAMKKVRGMYHVSGRDIMSIFDMVNIIADFWCLDASLITPVRSDELNQPAKRPPRTGFILDKAKRDLGYEPCSFVEGLRVVDEQLKMQEGMKK